MNTYNVILGVDVSKLTLDISCAERQLHLQVANTDEGFAVFQKWCLSHQIEFANTLVVMEHTGGYEYRFIRFCEALPLAYCRISGLAIKNSMGITRGKNDKVDAFRISRYGEEKIRRLVPDKPVNEHIAALKQLLAFRKKLVRDITAMQNFIKGRQHMYAPKKSDRMIGISRDKIKANTKYLETVEEEIITLIGGDEALQRNYRILTSIKGVGPVNAWMTLAYTANFTSFTDGRKYAVYVGVVPFDHSSGTSIHGKKRVSHMANKELKQELNQAAKVAIIHDPEIRAYAERKRKDKCYKLVLNNVKFKLILRMFSLIKRGEMYTPNYQRTA